MKHIQKQEDSYSDINILSDYTVTDKADVKKITIINKKGELYLLNNRFGCSVYGIKTKESYILIL